MNKIIYDAIICHSFIDWIHIEWCAYVYVYCTYTIKIISWLKEGIQDVPIWGSSHPSKNYSKDWLLIDVSLQSFDMTWKDVDCLSQMKSEVFFLHDKTEKIAWYRQCLIDFMSFVLCWNHKIQSLRKTIIINV